MIIVSLLCFGCHAQDKKDPVQEVHSFQLGETTIRVRETVQQPSGNMVFIQLHDNEKTAVETALQTINEHGGKFITIENAGERNITFILNNEKYRFDPNRMFTEAGRKQTLEVFKNYHPSAAAAIKRFSEFILDMIPGSAVVIAIHNNTDHQYSVDDYQGNRKADAGKVYVNRSMDPDDFIFTTDSSLYRQIVSEDINVVLQDNERVTDDGSLSVFYGRRGRPYINIEAEHGHLEEQSRLIRSIIKVMKDP